MGKHNRIPPAQTLLLIGLPMLATFACLRIYLHLVRVQHVYPGGYLIHHLFTGALIDIPAAFILAFGTRHRLLEVLARVALGIGSAMILDEVIYLVATNATDEDYISSVSLCGALALLSIATALLIVLYRISCGKTSNIPRSTGAEFHATQIVTSHDAAEPT